MLRNCIDPVLCVRVSFDLLLVLVILQSDVKLEGLESFKPGLHDSIARKSKNILLVKLELVFRSSVKQIMMTSFCDNQSLASRLLNLLH